MGGFWETIPHFLREYDAQADQIESLKACVNGDISPEQAAKKLTTYIESSQTPLQMQQRLGALWTMLNTAAVLDAPIQPTVVHVLRVIRTFPAVEEPTGEGEGHMDLEDGDLWRHLCYFASDWADGYNHWAARYFLDQKRYANADAASHRAIWVSANKYAALLAATGDPALSLYGGVLTRGSYTFVEVLENELRLDQGSGARAPAVPEAAAQFFIHAAPEVYRLCRDKHVIRPGTMARGSLWHGEGDFSVERWEFWRQRWHDMAHSESLPREVREAARQAEQAMNNRANT